MERARSSSSVTQRAYGGDPQGLTGSWDLPVAPGESIAWPAVYMYLTDAGFEMRFRVWDYVNGTSNYSSTVFDSGYVDIPLT